MPTRSTDSNRAPLMAVAVVHHHFPPSHNPSLKPSPLIRRRRLLSFPHSSSHRPHPQSPILNLMAGRTSAALQSLVEEVSATISSGAPPIPALAGLGGALFLRNRSGDCLAVVKPFNAGETGVREAAAYLLDHAAFAGVPPTALIQISHPPTNLLASIQRFVPHEFDAGDLGPSRFSVASVHRIGILDIRLLNTDRHAGNLLVQKQSVDKNRTFDGAELATELVPIDHGLCLPELLEDPYFEWLHWPQAAVPFSGEEIQYVSKIDPFKDAELLRAELPSIREPAIRILILCTIFLKKAVDFGLCLSEIGGMMTREFCRMEEGESFLESLCTKAEESIGAESELGEEDDVKEYQELCEKPLDLNCHGAGVERSKMISFKDKNEEQWMLFLERFEQILTEVFEVMKKVEVKLKPGSPCNI
ncbi:phosphatidylinositol 4-kinase gamma 8-like [Phalaenopsis equestris]|uniref:phosphatidylinositol 4-kinase gamma 8-like n=1 Tax=Phalaenopsis equestris TaxID=78828 RepID=UPI0009E4C3F6|nr:phosphatidylinositol 4-kinase gamma 8-like [Phalaenopsis equestris]